MFKILNSSDWEGIGEFNIWLVDANCRVKVVNSVGEVHMFYQFVW